MGPDKRRNTQPGLIERFLEDSSRETMNIYLYPREIRRLQAQFPQVCITQGESLRRQPKLFKCTVSKK